MREKDEFLMAKAVCWKGLESTRAKVLWTGHLSQADPSMVKVQMKSHYQCVGGGGYVAGKTQRSGDWDKEGHIRVHLNIEQKQFSQPKKEWQILDQEVYEFGTRLSFLRLFLDSAPVLQLSKILQLPSAKKNSTTHKYLLLPLKACRRSYRLGPPLLSVWSHDTWHHTI